VMIDCDINRMIARWQIDQRSRPGPDLRRTSISLIELSARNLKKINRQYIVIYSDEGLKPLHIMIQILMHHHTIRCPAVLSIL
jgi:hypothetical protein